MNKQYLVTLKPITPFFFGGENTFGEDPKLVNYFVKSNYFPQQTTLLGMLRHELLIQNGLLGKHTSDWDTLIGAESFDGSNDKILEYGAIKSLSPVFLSNEKQDFIPNTIDWVKYKVDKEKKTQKMQVSFGEEKGFMYNNAFQALTTVMVGEQPFDPKHGSTELLASADGKEWRQWDFEKDFEKKDFFQNGLFVKHQQVGIHRVLNKMKNNSDGSFYKQIFYTLKDDFAFAFFVELDLPAGKKLDSRILQMGGERSTFQMKIEHVDSDSFKQKNKAKSFNQLFNTHTFGTYPKDVIILTSPAYTDATIFEYCRFAIADNIPFRNIRTIKKTDDDYIRIKGGAIQKQAEELYLLKQGSVLYCNNTQSVINCLEKTHFQNIGYNHFIIY